MSAFWRQTGSSATRSDVPGKQKEDRRSFRDLVAAGLRSVSDGEGRLCSEKRSEDELSIKLRRATSDSN